MSKSMRIEILIMIVLFLLATGFLSIAELIDKEPFASHRLIEKLGLAALVAFTVRSLGLVLGTPERLSIQKYRTLEVLGVEVAHRDLTEETVAGRLANANTRIKVCKTFFPEDHTARGGLIRALERGVEVDLVSLHPDDAVLEERSRSLGKDPDFGERQIVESLSAIVSRLRPFDKCNIRVRFCCAQRNNFLLAVSS